MEKVKSFRELKGKIFGLNKKSLSVGDILVTYKVLARYDGVVIKVPKKGENMCYVPAITIGDNAISEHWHNGKGLKGIFLNLFFYNITKRQLGKKIVATVEVIEKTVVDDGRKFIMLNVYHTPEAREECKYTFAMPKDGTGNFDIHPDVAEKIYFQPRKHNKIRL